jgi:hypothetical protein
MAVGWLARRLAAVALVCGCVFARAAYAQGQDDLTQLFAEVERLYGQGKFAEAASVAERAVALAREHHGEEYAEFGSAGPLRGGRTFAQAQPGHPREGVGGRTIPMSARRYTTWPCCIGSRDVTPTQSP